MPSNANGFFEGTRERDRAHILWSPTLARLKYPPVDCDGLTAMMNPLWRKPSLSEVLASRAVPMQSVEVDACHAPDRSTHSSVPIT